MTQATASDNQPRSEMTPEQRRMYEMCRGLLGEPGFAKAVDDVAAVFMVQVVDEIIERVGTIWSKHVPDDHDAPEFAISLVLGWILGYAAAGATPDRREDVAMNHILVATHAAAACAKL